MQKGHGISIDRHIVFSVEKYGHSTFIKYQVFSDIKEYSFTV